MKKKKLIIFFTLFVFLFTLNSYYFCPVSGNSIQLLDSINVEKARYARLDKEGKEQTLLPTQVSKIIAELRDKNYRRLFVFGEEMKYSNSGYILMLYLDSGDAVTIEIYDLSKIKLTNQSQNKSEYYQIIGERLNEMIFD